MTPPAPTSNERERLAALERYQMLDTPSEAEFDDLTSLAAQICGTPIALISLVDAHRQWFKSKVGLEVTETAREVSFCGHAIHSRHLLEVPNTLEEFLFYDNPLVTDGPKIRFYAGMPLATSDGQNLGTLCVMDQVPRQLTQAQRDALGRLGRQVMNQMELYLTNRRLATASRDLGQVEERSRLVIETAPDAIVMMDAHGRITLVNSQTERLFGYAREELIGQPAAMLLPERPQTANFFSARRPATKKKGRELSGLRKNGTELPIEIRLHPLPASAGASVLVSISDVSARKRMGNQVNRLKHDLKQTRRQLARTSRELTDLAAVVAQDFKTPLRSIGSLANWLVTSYANRLDGSGREQLNLLALKLRRLNALVDGALTGPSKSRSRETHAPEALEIAEVFSPDKSAATRRTVARDHVDKSPSRIVAGPGYAEGRVQLAGNDSESDTRVSEIALAL